MKIKNLKKNNRFKFNNAVFVVVRKWINEDKPLIAKLDVHYHEEHRFWSDDLDIELVGK